jgi:hypothetical protein
MLHKSWTNTCPRGEPKNRTYFNIFFNNKLKNTLESDLKKKRLSYMCHCSLKSSLLNTNIKLFYRIFLVQKLLQELFDRFYFELHFCSYLLWIFYQKYFVWKLIKMLPWKEITTPLPSLCLMAQDLSLINSF